MIDQNTTDAPLRLNSSGRIGFAAAGLCFFGFLIWYLVLWGQPGNGLHSTAMTGSLLALMGLLAMLVSPALTALIEAFRARS